ncbi:MAG: AAA family ATPase [Parvularculaceae bacterium]
MAGEGIAAAMARDAEAAGADAKSVACAVVDAAAADARKGVFRLDAASRAALHLHAGDVASARCGDKVAYGRIMPAAGEDSKEARIALSADARAFLGVDVGGEARVSPAPLASAARLVLSLKDGSAASILGLKKLLRRELMNRPAFVGERVEVRLVGGRRVVADVKTVVPAGEDAGARAAIVGEGTIVDLASDAPQSTPASAVGYDELGGLGPQLARVREMIETPIKNPTLFAHLGVEPPKGVLLSGPPGTGKTLLARAVAEECGAAFFQINGPEIASKHFGDSEKQLREIFDAAARKAPSVVFIDEIDAIAPKRESLAGDRQVERRGVAQLLTLMDGLSVRGQITVMAATNLPDAIDGALRRPGRFDREISFTPPDAAGRLEILAIHTRGMPLADDVDLKALAAETHGYVGADLAALAREAGMAALRRSLDLVRTDAAVDVSAIRITRADFQNAERDIVPTAVREVFTETPTVGWADVGGQERVKQALIEAVVWPLRHEATLARAGVGPARGVLMAGPPGCGKTLIARALAKEAGVNFISVRGPQLLSQYFGEAEKAVRDVFAKARLASPCVVFFDEIDAIAPIRGDGGAAMDRVVAQLLTEMDGVERRAGVFVLAATNRPEAVDPALLRPGRFDMTVTLAEPDIAARGRIFDIHTRSIALADDVDAAALARASDGLSGADIEAVCRQAGLYACRRMFGYGAAPVDEKHLWVRQTDFEAALTDLRERRAALARNGAAGRAQGRLGS